LILQINILTLILTYLPIIISMSFEIAVLVFGILMYKNNKYKYGLFLMISSIFALTYYVIFFSVNYPNLFTVLFIEFELPATVIATIMQNFNIVFIILNMISAVFLVLSIYYVYKTHNINRNQYQG